MNRARSVLVALALLTNACGSPVEGADGGADPVDTGVADADRGDAAPRVRSTVVMPSGAICPDGSTLTYDNFAADFFASYCTRCHSSTLVGSTARSGAPLGFDFDALAGIEPRLARIDAVAAAGPTRVNIFMPLSAPQPSDAERDQLGEWIACGAP